MTLEEYCSQVIERLKSCKDSSHARHLLAQVDLALTNSRISNRTQKTFWETLIKELDAVELKLTSLPEKNAAAELGAAIAAARTAIFEYHEVLIGCDELRS